MPPRSAEEKERRKQLQQQRLEARKLKKQQEEEQKQRAETLGETPEGEDCANKSSDENKSPCFLLGLPDDPFHNVLKFLPARDLGAFIMTCRSVNLCMGEAKVHHLFSRLQAKQKSEGPGKLHVSIQLCENEMQIKELLSNSLEGSGDTGRLITKRAKRGNNTSADEYVAYARFIEEAVLGRTIQVSFHYSRFTCYIFSSHKKLA